MAHNQSKAVHHSKAQHKKNFQTVNAKDSADSAHRSPQMEVTHADNTTLPRPIKEPPHEFRIMGFPWQFAAVMGIVAGGLLVIVLKAIGLL